MLRPRLSIKHLLLGLATCMLFSIGLSTDCHAQQSRYTPRRPTLSPYLEFFRPRTGVLPNYQQFVQPAINYNNAVAQQRSLNQFQQSQIDQLRQNQGNAGMIQTGAVPGRRRVPTFLNYSHYYSPAPTSPPRLR